MRKIKFAILPLIDKKTLACYYISMLEIKNLSYNVNEKDAQKDILKNVSLTFEDNKIYVITGPNGSGKSTLVKLIMGLLKASDGQILFDGKDITNLAINERANLGISYAFQQPVTFKGLKVRDLLDIASGEKNNVDKLCEHLSTVGLCAKDYINRPLDDKLSGGELKRIELAMVLARKTKVNIFDEPEAGIDLWSFDNLTNIFSSLNNCNIIVSHQKKILDIADEIILIKNGQLIAQGKPEEIYPLLEGNTCHRLRGENG